MWFNLAASKAKRDEAVIFRHNRDRIAEKMTSEQIAEAQRLAKEWKPKREEKSSEMPRDTQKSFDK